MTHSPATRKPAVPASASRWPGSPTDTGPADRRTCPSRRASDVRLTPAVGLAADPALLTSVEVWNSFLEKWVEGFVLVGRDGKDCWLRRRSDQSVLPTPIQSDRIRRG